MSTQDPWKEMFTKHIEDDVEEYKQRMSMAQQMKNKPKKKSFFDQSMKYRIKEYDAVGDEIIKYEGRLAISRSKVVEKRYQIEYMVGGFWGRIWGWQDLTRVYKTEQEARDKIEEYKVHDEVDNGKRVRYINVD